MKVEYQDKMLSLRDAETVMNDLVTGEAFNALGKWAQSLAKRQLQADINSVKLALSMWDHLKTTPPIKANVFPLKYFERDFAARVGVNQEDIIAAARLLERDGLIKYQDGYLIITEMGLKNIEVGGRLPSQ